MTAMAAANQFYGTGRRKTSTARVFLRPGKGEIIINKKPIEKSFPTETLRLIVRSPPVTAENDAPAPDRRSGFSRDRESSVPGRG